MNKGPQRCVVQLTLTRWIDEKADQMVCPAMAEIKGEVTEMLNSKTSKYPPWCFAMQVRKALVEAV